MHIFSRYHLFFMVFIAIALPTQATTVKSLSVETMAKESDAIIEGTVTARESRWNEEKNRIFTYTDISVTSSHKGLSKSGMSVRIRQIGGDVDGISQRVVGNAEFTVGEEVLVFLVKDDESNIHFVVGMAQGKYAINRTATPPTIHRSVQGLHRMGGSQAMQHIVKLKKGVIKKVSPKHEHTSVSSASSMPSVLTLPAFRTRVLQALR